MVEQVEIPSRAEDEEDQARQHYIIEVWRRERGGIMFVPIATNSSIAVFMDELGCSVPFHGRVLVQ